MATRHGKNASMDVGLACFSVPAIRPTNADPTRTPMTHPVLPLYDVMHMYNGTRMRPPKIHVEDITQPNVRRRRAGASAPYPLVPIKSMGPIRYV